MTKVYANCRGKAPNGEPLDGHLDGWSWHAWSGPFIAYGSTEEHAVENLLAKIPRGSLANVSDDELVSLYDELGSTAAVGERLGVGHVAVWRRLNAIGAVRPAGKITHVTDAELIAIYEKLGSLDATGGHFGVAGETVRQRLIAAGAAMNPPGRRGCGTREPCRTKAAS